MRKPVFAICEQQRCRSACASMQSDSTFVVHCLGSIIPLLATSQKFRTLASFCGCAGRFVSYLVGNPEDRFSREAQLE